MNSLLTKLSQLEFYAIDLQLYIDTHPTDKQAIDLYNRTVQESNAVKKEYEKLYGPILSYVSPIDSQKSNWIDEPWPWELKFNLTR